MEENFKSNNTNNMNNVLTSIKPNNESPSSTININNNKNNNVMKNNNNNNMGGAVATFCEDCRNHSTSMLSPTLVENLNVQAVSSQFGSNAGGAHVFGTVTAEKFVGRFEYTNGGTPADVTLAPERSGP